MYLEEGQYYGIDGDIIDERTKTIARLRLQLSTYRKRESAEDKLRQSNSAVNDAWNQYRTLLTLAKVHE